MNWPGGIILDFDDTLVETSRVRRPQLDAELAAWGASDSQIAEVARRWGDPFSELVEGIVREQDLEAFTRSYLERMGSVRASPTPGASRLVTLARRNGIGVYVLSSSRGDLVEHDLKEVGIDVDDVFGSDRTRHHKPDGRVFDEVAATIGQGVDLASWVYIGDSVNDARAAHGRVPFLAVTTGSTDSAEFIGCGVSPDAIHSSLLSVVDHLSGATL